MEPSFKEAQYGFNDKLKSYGEMYRNTLISEAVLMSEAAFADLKFSFKT